MAKPTYRDEKLVSIEAALIGFTATATKNINESVKIRLNAVLKILHELNAQINYTNAMRTLLQSDSPTKEQSNKLKALVSGLTKQNDILTKLPKELAKLIYVSDQPLSELQEEAAKKICSMVDNKIRDMQIDNKNLSEQARMLRLGKKIEPDTPAPKALSTIKPKNQ